MEKFSSLCRLFIDDYFFNLHFIILNFIPDIPCSCGGVLEKMSWNEHLIFNIAFVVLGLVAILLQNVI